MAAYRFMMLWEFIAHGVVHQIWEAWVRDKWLFLASECFVARHLDICKCFIVDCSIEIK